MYSGNSMFNLIDCNSFSRDYMFVKGGVHTISSACVNFTCISLHEAERSNGLLIDVGCTFSVSLPLA